MKCMKSESGKNFLELKKENLKKKVAQKSSGQPDGQTTSQSDK